MTTKSLPHRQDSQEASASHIKDSSDGLLSLSTYNPRVLRKLGALGFFAAEIVERKFLELSPSCPDHNNGACKLTGKSCAVEECPRLKGVEKDGGVAKVSQHAC